MLTYIAVPVALLSLALQGCGSGGSSGGNGTSQLFSGVCVFDVDRTLTCGNNLLEEGCPHGHNCYSEQTDSKTAQPLQADAYLDKEAKPMDSFAIKKLVDQQEVKCAPPDSETCYDRSYIWNKAWNSPKVDYQLRLSKDIQSVVKLCHSKNFAIAIATHGGSDFTNVEDSCPDWDPTCPRPSSCKLSKRCHAVKALQLETTHPELADNCDADSDFVHHDPTIPKDEMVTAILHSLKVAKRIDANSNTFDILFFDDEGSNRKAVAYRQANYSSSLGVQVQTCAFSPDEWTSYQSEDEGWRGNNLAMGFDVAHIAKQTSAKPAWSDTTNTGCKNTKFHSESSSSNDVDSTVV